MSVRVKPSPDRVLIDRPCEWHLVTATRASRRGGVRDRTAVLPRAHGLTMFRLAFERRSRSVAVVYRCHDADGAARYIATGFVRQANAPRSLYYFAGTTHLIGLNAVVRMRKRRNLDASPSGSLGA